MITSVLTLSPSIHIRLMFVVSFQNVYGTRHCFARLVGCAKADPYKGGDRFIPLPVSVVKVHQVLSLQEVAGVSDMSSQGGRGDGRGTAEIDFSGWVAHAPGEVAVHRC